MTKVLLLTDFTNNARNAIAYGIALFKENANYTLLNACLEPSMFADKPILITDSIQKLSEKGLKEDRHFIEEQFPQIKLKITSQTEFGTIESLLEDVSIKEDFDYIIMGTKGETTQRWLQESSAKTAAQHSHVPVIIVPDKAVFNKIASIVFASDLSEDESFLIDLVANLALLFDANLTILHVDKNPKSTVESAFEFNKIKERTPYPKLNYVDLVEDDVESAIITYVEENKTDLLAVTTYTTTLMQRIFHQSVTKNLIQHIHLPLLVFNRKKYSYIFLG